MHKTAGMYVCVHVFINNIDIETYLLMGGADIK